MAESKGMFVDTSYCTGCKGCQVACKEWNNLPMADHIGFTGNSYDNTEKLSAQNWRHVKFIEQFSDDRSMQRWLFMSDSCKHCQHAGCMQVCPTNAIIRTEFDTVYVDQDVCIGCRYCVAGCPFGVISMDEVSGTAKKCTLCYDRLQEGMQPACAQTCPTGAIQFGNVEELRAKAEARAQVLRKSGEQEVHIYGTEETFGGLNVFYLLLDKPEVYGLPTNGKLPSQKLGRGYVSSLIGLVGVGLAGLLTFRANRMKMLEEQKDEHFSS
ncbi:MAG TPA: 4Fe-4S dicluster domain-containing protein [Bacillota bacterium]|nr:4Fe-4S dicluster domain-containing protein [Bacillota bacterium]